MHLNKEELIGDLQKFMKNYERRANQRNFELLLPLISNHATYWFSDGSFNSIKEIRQAFEKTWENLPSELYQLSEFQWLVTTETYAVCIYKFKSENTKDGKKFVFKGRGTNVLEKIGGSWQIIHEHLSLEPQ